MTPISQDDRIALNALVDGQLSPSEAAALEARIAAEAALAAARNEIAATRTALRNLPRPAVSPRFLEAIDALAEPAKPAVVPQPPRRNAWFEGWQNIAAAVVITAFLASGATYWLSAPRPATLEELIADGHHRSLLAATPVDVQSSDRHTVKPWLDARLGISPPAPDLAPTGYPLVGGRVEVLGGQAVPALVYRHNEHTISLVARPSAAAATVPRAFASGGYNMLEWIANGFAFTVVSDLEPSELAAFVDNYRAAAS